ncbi:deoxyribose-phosphate aldolase [Lawsonibacter faecis]|uniref:Deoxyribose-phosphate aldolase n=1 Tax=Lawsonibacter faecis TaxID=2763052 RepID=A0A8J6JIS4_9FIRM|nr:deoxyribose-phosphate aldolase [Lawsonibacter faecis]MBC5735479.1 deoxyribose-phosphate aldolase [Lawsonibacter faecis]
MQCECCGDEAGRFAPESLARYIDHTLLKPEAAVSDIERVCDEAAAHHFASVCVNPSYAALVAKRLRGSSVTPCCVIGFPFGTHTPEAKAAETAQAVADGVMEVDMVLNVGAVKSGDWGLVERDIMAVVKAAGNAGVKVILETCLLTDEEKVHACEIAKRSGASFVKTSTGYSVGGATPHDVALMRKTVGPGMGVKASGGIRTYEDAVAMLQAGANRLGCSAGIKIIEGKTGTEGY